MAVSQYGPEGERRFRGASRSRAARRGFGRRPAQLEIAPRIFTLPGLDKKKRDGTRRVNGKVCNTPVETGVSAFAPVRVATVRPQRPDTFDHSRKAAQNLADIVHDQRIEVRAICAQTERFADGAP
jgi:hypothetical protein